MLNKTETAGKRNGKRKRKEEEKKKKI